MGVRGNERADCSARKATVVDKKEGTQLILAGVFRLPACGPVLELEVIRHVVSGQSHTWVRQQRIHQHRTGTFSWHVLTEILSRITDTCHFNIILMLQIHK